MIVARGWMAPPRAEEESVRFQTFFSRLFAVIALSFLVACGSDNPASPSGSKVVLKGTLVGAPSGVLSESAAVSAHASSGGRITVTVQEDPSLSVTVSGNGTFEITGLPVGSFTLVFSRDGVVLGTIAVSGVQPEVEIKIVVKVKGNAVVLVSLQMGDGPVQGGDDPDGDGDGTKSCMISGGRVGDGIELEGNVDSGNSSKFKLRVNGNRSGDLVDVNAGGASFQCKGDKTSSSECKAKVTEGAKVHVRGTLNSCSQSAAQVTASEVKVQK
jgi:hypothetical protein